MSQNDKRCIDRFEFVIFEDDPITQEIELGDDIRLNGIIDFGPVKTKNRGLNFLDDLYMMGVFTN